MGDIVDVMQTQIDKIIKEVMEYKENQIRQLLTEIGINVEQPISAVREELNRKGISVGYKRWKGTETIRAFSKDGTLLAERRFTMKGVL